MVLSLWRKFHFCFSVTMPVEREPCEACNRTQLVGSCQFFTIHSTLKNVALRDVTARRHDHVITW